MKTEVVTLVVTAVAILTGIVFRHSVPWKAIVGIGGVAVAYFSIFQFKKHKKAKLYTQGDGCPEALNQLLEFFWPHISTFVTEKIKTSVEPAVRKALPQIMQSGFSFDREYCNLGEKAIQFPKAEVKESTQLTDSGTIDVLSLKTEVLWAADLSVKLNFGEVSLGVKSLTIKGDLIIEFVGLKDRPPYFEGVRYFFLNTPEMDLDFSGAIVGLNLDMIKQKILGVLEEKITNMLVVPQRMGKVLGDDVDFFRIVKPRPEGVLKVRVHRANNLIAADAATLITDAKSDPYVIASFGTDKFRSETVTHALNPVFDFEFRVLVSSMSTQKIRFELFDEDLLTAVTGCEDDALGEAKVLIADMVGWGAQPQVVDLLDGDGLLGNNGTLELSAEYFPLLLEDGEHAGELNAGCIFVGVYHAKDLKVSDEEMQYWVTARFKGPKEETQKSSPKVKVVPLPLPDEADLAHARLKRDVLKKYSIPREDLAELLDADPEMLDGKEPTPRSGKAARKHEVVFNHAFEIETDSVRQTELTLTLKGQAKEQAEQDFGEYTLRMSDLLEKGAALSFVHTLGSGDDAALKVRIQARFLGEPSCAVPARASELQRRRSTLMG